MSAFFERQDEKKNMKLEDFTCLRAFSETSFVLIKCVTYPESLYRLFTDTNSTGTFSWTPIPRTVPIYASGQWLEVGLEYP